LKGKLIVVEGTDCSGKETQVKLLEKKLNNRGIKAKHISFPNYDTPTGKVIGACYLGKKELCDDLGIKDGLFIEGASHVDSFVSSLYYAADRKYNINKILDLLNDGVNVILDRYTFSNMAHQGGKIINQAERFSFFKKIEILEFDLLELPRPDLVVLLYVPYHVTVELQKSRNEELDQNEIDKKHLKLAEQTYLELRALYHFKMIECVEQDKMRSIEDINDELEKIVEDIIL
jgi:dTMP kinase